MKLEFELPKTTAVICVTSEMEVWKIMKYDNIWQLSNKDTTRVIDISSISQYVDKVVK